MPYITLLNPSVQCVCPSSSVFPSSIKRSILPFLYFQPVKTLDVFVYKVQEFQSLSTSQPECITME